MNGKTEQKKKLKNIFIAYPVLIIVLAVIPLGNSDVLTNTFIISFRADHLLHVAIFIPWAFFCIRLKKNLPSWFVWGMLYAVVSECVQYFVPYRSFNISDMLANVIGVSAGFCIFLPLKNRFDEVVKSRKTVIPVKAGIQNLLK